MPREICLLYWGPRGAGKSANLDWICRCVDAEPDRVGLGSVTLDLGKLGGVPALLHLLEVPPPGTLAPESRREALRRADGVILVLDSHPGRLGANRQVVDLYEEDLRALDRDPRDMPLVLQWNKRDLPHASPLRELDLRLNPGQAAAFSASADRGQGVTSTLQALVGMVLAQRDHPQPLCRRTLTLLEELEVPSDSQDDKRPQASIPLCELPPPRLTPAWGDLVGRRVGPCQIESKLGEGGMGAVYLARHLTLQQQVVVKTLKAEYAQDGRRVRRFFLEARAAARLDHPNVVRVQDVGTTSEGLHYIVMQYVEGRDLLRRVQDEGPLPPAEAIRLVLDVAQALVALHAEGIVHRDVKAENLVQDPGGQVKLIDFGLAKDLQAAANLTRDGAMIGTPAYMAPEIGRVADIDGRVDVYSLGLTFYLLLTGLAPFQGYSIHAVILGEARLVPPEAVVPDLPPGYRAVLGRMLAWDREQRYPDAARLSEDLRALQQGRAPAAVAPPTRVFDLKAASRALGRVPPPAPPPIPPTIPPEGLLATRKMLRLAEPEPEPAPSEPVKLVGYVVLGQVEAERWSTTYRGWDPDRETVLRLRELRLEGALGPGVERELGAARRFEHPSAARLLDAPRGPAGPVLISEEREALPLAELLAQPGPQDPQEILHAVRDVSCAVAAMHEAGLIHGSICASSVGVTPDGQGVLLDHDLAAVRLGLASDQGLTLGDGDWVPPECRSGRRPTPRSDLYALGTVLVTALRARGCPPPSADALAVCAKARERRPERRYRDVQAWVADLDRLLAGRRPHARLLGRLLGGAQSLAAQVPPWARLVAAGLVVALLLAVQRAVTHAHEAELRELRLEKAIQKLEQVGATK